MGKTLYKRNQQLPLRYRDPWQTGLEAFTSEASAPEKEVKKND